MIMKQPNIQAQNRSREEIENDISYQKSLIETWKSYVADDMIDPGERMNYVNIVADANSKLLQLDEELKQHSLLGEEGAN